ncbi:MAG: hypothetical protein LQ338_002898 [Usnochroma carphineum]|nr:MAG: hypothetical protein LQ338_002898 [Usnochroma carphineum]
MAEPTVQQTSTAAKPPLKRPLFTKPAWAQEDKSSSATDFFRRSNQSYVHIAAEEERKRQRNLARKERGRARVDTHKEPAEKRRRTSPKSDSGDDSDHSSSDDEGVPKRTEKQKSPPVTKPEEEVKKQLGISTESESSPKSLLKRYETEVVAKKKSIPSNIVDLEDEDDAPEAEQDDLVEVTAVKRTQLRPEEDDFPPSDDEFAELARKAREKARRKRLEADVLSPPPDSPPSSRPDDHFRATRHIHEPTPPPAAPDPVVSILITSRIANTNPLIVNRRVSQRLKDVRVTWCQRQGFTSDFTASVFLTWRGKRLFDVTTCRSLGIGVDSNGNIVMKGQKDILGEEERQIHMEAMTEEILEDYKRTKRREAEGEGELKTEAKEEQPLVPEKKEPQVRIILKAKGHSDFKLIVKPTTKISRIVNAFMSDKKIDNAREVFLSFDGDRLASDSEVGETELNDMDYVDVYVK